jgi:hypothetical protein
MRALIGGVLAVAGLAGRAEAGRTHFGWLYADEVNPERGVELETWVWEEEGLAHEDGDVDETYLWWAPIVGVNDHVELAFPVAFVHEVEGDERVTSLSMYGAEVRWRPDSPDPLERGAFATLLRGAVQRLVNEHGAVRTEADVVVAWERGAVHAAVDLGATLDLDREGVDRLLVRPAAGVSVRVVEDLRFGAEVFGVYGIEGYAIDWLAAGPDVGWTHGRFWIAGALGIGLGGIDFAPRVNLGVAL